MRAPWMLCISLLLLLSASPAKADAETEALATCIADSTTGKDRKDLIRWVFAMISTHPEIKSIANIKDEERDSMDRTTAALFERLLTENCKSQTIAATKSGGQAAIKSAFSTFGGVAMQELTANSAVNAAFQKFTVYLNKEKFDAILSGK